MTDKYDSNGDYANYSSDFKRKSSSEKGNTDNEADGDNNEEGNPASQKVNEYVRELLAEKILLDVSKHPHVARLIDQGRLCAF